MDKKVYIAGKITGDPDYQEKFLKAAGFVQYVGKDIPLNPATLPLGMWLADYMRICFAMIDVADVVVFLPDYQDSDGAWLEFLYCEYVGKPTMRYNNYVEEASRGSDETV